MPSRPDLRRSLELAARALALVLLAWMIVRSAAPRDSAEVYERTDSRALEAALAAWTLAPEPTSVHVAAAFAPPQEVDHANRHHEPAGHQRAGDQPGGEIDPLDVEGSIISDVADQRAEEHDVGAQLAGAGVCRTVRVASGPVHGARVVPAPSTSV